MARKEDVSISLKGYLCSKGSLGSSSGSVVHRLSTGPPAEAHVKLGLGFLASSFVDAGMITSLIAVGSRIKTTSQARAVPI